MAKNKKKGSRALNPPFDHRMTSIGAPDNGHRGPLLKRGWIASDNTTTPAPPLPGRVNFLFNPPQVSVSHPLNPNYSSASYNDELQQYDAEWVGDTLGQAGEVGVSLLFDRTYELWDNSYRNSLAGQYGAYVDVLAFYKLLGIVDSSTSPLVGPVAPGANRPDIVNFGLFPQNPLRGTPLCYLYLGPNSLKFRGFVDNFNVSYTHFSRGMIPVRCQIDLSMQMYFAPSESATDPSGGSYTLPGTPDAPIPNTPLTPPPAPGHGYLDPSTGQWVYTP